MTWPPCHILSVFVGMAHYLPFLSVLTQNKTMEDKKRKVEGEGQEKNPTQYSTSYRPASSILYRVLDGTIRNQLIYNSTGMLLPGSDGLWTWGGFWFCVHFRRQHSCGKVMFLHVSVILSAEGMSGRHPLDGRPLGRHPPCQTPPGQTPLDQADTPKWRPLQRTLRILLDCIFVTWNDWNSFCLGVLCFAIEIWIDVIAIGSKFMYVCSDFLLQLFFLGIENL